MNNYTIKEFYEQLIKLINSCGLPIGTAYFIVKDVLNELKEGFYQCANEEANQQPHTEIREFAVNPSEKIEDSTVKNIDINQININDQEEKEDGSSDTVTENL